MKKTINVKTESAEFDVFVFGSNLAGRHGKGAALTAAREYGAKCGKGIGHVGRSYAIPTKDENLKTLPLETINYYVKIFLKYAKDTPELTYKVTRIGCGLAGYTDDDIAPMFFGAPNNCILPENWK